MVHFIEKPRRKKVARLSRYLRAIYDGEKVTLRYDNTKILSGQKRNGNHKKTKICTLENFLEEAQKIKSHNHESYTFDQPDHVFEFYQNDEGGFNGSFMDIDIEVFRKEDRLFATFGIASYELYKGDLEGSIRDLIGGCLWQASGHSWQKSFAYKRGKKATLELFKKGHVKWIGSQAITTSTTPTQQ